MTNWTEKVILNKTRGKAISLSCSRCAIGTKHKILASVHFDYKAMSTYLEDDVVFEYEEMWSKADYEIIRCQNCESVSFRQTSMFSEDTDFSPDLEFEIPIERIEVYPKHLLGKKGITELSHLPPNINEIYQETRSAIANDLGILAGMGLRALIEAVCKEKKAKGRKLEQLIDDLVTLGFLAKASADFLHGLRILGNEAAHDGKRHSNEDLLSALEIVEHLLTTVYIIPVRAKNLPKRKTLTTIVSATKGS